MECHLDTPYNVPDIVVTIANNDIDLVIRYGQTHGHTGVPGDGPHGRVFPAASPCLVPQVPPGLRCPHVGVPMGVSCVPTVNVPTCLSRVRRISDRGGGIPHELLDKVTQYHFSTAESSAQDPRLGGPFRQLMDLSNSPMHG